MSSCRARLRDAEATGEMGARLARALGNAGAVIALSGDLGTGKTTLARGFLHALGYEGRVRSPTYTLVEPYLLGGRRVFHVDLYRLSSPDELEYLGLGEIEPDADVLLVEWPERVGDALPAADIVFYLRYPDEGDGRDLEVQTRSPVGDTIGRGLGLA